MTSEHSILPAVPVLKELREESPDYIPTESSSAWSTAATTMMMAGIKDEDQSDSNSSSESQHSFCDQSTQSSRRGHKRKESQAVDPDEDREEKRRKNREAAKRCRDKKQQQTENLKCKNVDLENENCNLAKQRDDLIRKCREYQHEIEQHKQRGCMVPHFSPPYDLDQILNLSSPPASPSFSESAHSTSSCPSPARSISPGPPPRQIPRPACADATHKVGVLEAPHQLQQVEDVRAVNPSKNFSDTSAMSATVVTVPPERSEPLQSPDQGKTAYHYLRVRNKDGTHKILCLDHEAFLKFAKKMQRAKISSNQSLQPTAAIPVSAAQSQHSMLPRDQVEPLLRANVSTDTAQSQLTQQVHLQQNSSNTSKPGQKLVSTDTAQSQLTQQVDLQQNSSNTSKPGQKLDTFEDLLSVLKGNTKASELGFEMQQINPSNVLIKEEPVDADYEQQSLSQPSMVPELPTIKHEDLSPQSGSANKVLGSYSQWSATAQHIRAGLDVLTNPEESSSTNAHIQNIVQYLKTDDGSLTIPAVSQNSSQGTMQTLTRTSPVPLTRTTVSTVLRPRPIQTGIFVTSSAPMGSLSKVNAGCDQGNHQVDQGMRQAVSPRLIARAHNDGNKVPQQRTTTIISGMQNVQQPVRAKQQMGSASPKHVEKPQMPSRSAAAIVVQPSKVVSPLTLVASVAQQGNITVPQNVLPEASFQQTSNSVWTSNSSQMPRSQVSFPPVTTQSDTIHAGTSQLENLAPQSVSPHQQPPTSTIDTSALAPIHLQMGVSENLMSESTSQIMEYLKANSIESMR